jgi:hypothetical protein
MYGVIDTKTNLLSLYQPSQEVCDLTAMVKDDYFVGEEILSRQWTELNNRSVIEDENRGEMMFNAFVDTSVEDPNEAWKWRGTRSMARNKGIAMHANLTANYLLPLFTAQNDEDEVDEGFSEVMRDIIEWMADPTNSEYQSSFLNVTFGMMDSPVTYLGAEFFEVYQTIREKKEDGSYSTKEILDEVLSGFQCPVYGASEILINNAYTRNVQKQKAIIKRRWVEKSELEAKYGEHDNWTYVQVGWKSVYNSDSGLFYDVFDEQHPTLVCEETWLNRRKDAEVCFLGGIYMGAENVDNNPIKHRDNRGAPKYNVTPFGYSRIGRHFFYYKSMMNCLGWDNMLYDAMSEVVMNKAFLEVDMPVAVSGSDAINSDIMFPKSVVTFENENAKIQRLMPESNMGAGFNALRETEKSMEDGSVNETISGNLPDASQKAYNVAQAQQAAKKLIGAVAKSLAESVIRYGDLMKDIAINHITIPQVDQLTSGAMKLKYRTFLVPKKTKGMNRKIKFDESLIGMEMTDEEASQEEHRMLEDSEYPDTKDSLIRINPEMFANFKFLSRVDVEEMFAKNSEYWQPILTNLTTQLANNQYVNQEELTKKLLYSYFQSDSDELINKTPTPVQPQGTGQGGNQLGNIINSKALSTLSNGVGVVQ